jgi:hypothetical protein
MSMFESLIVTAPSSQMNIYVFVYIHAKVFIETAAIPIAPSEGGGGVNIITGQLGTSIVHVHDFVHKETTLYVSYMYIFLHVCSAI